MIQLPRPVYAEAKSGNMSLEKLADYLLKNYPVYEIALSLAETINYEEPKPIVITKEEFAKHFRIRGVRDNGEAELRGRPKNDAQPL
jgi:thioredoxin-related protein